MGKQPLLLAAERAHIVALPIERLSERQIAKRLQCSRSSVHRSTEKFKKHKIYNNMKNNGRPRKTSRKDNHAILRALKKKEIIFC